MSQSAIFNLVLRDERTDKMLTASDYLRQRLKKIRADRAETGHENPIPTFRDIENSHVIYMRAVYRPYVATASEYVKVQSSGDNSSLKLGGNTIEFAFPTYGHFTSDMVFRVRFANVGTNSPVVSTDPNDNPTPRYRYCAYPGIRLFRQVGFYSAETLIDDYTRDEVSFVNKFRIPADRRVAWDRGMGQAETKSAEYFNDNGHTGTILFKEGMQTPKFLQPGQDLWIPLQFWMGEDASQALLNDLIPNTQRRIVAHLAPLSEILQAVDQNTGEVVPLPLNQLKMQVDLYVNNLFMNPEVYDVFASRVGFSLIRVHRRQTRGLNKPTDRVLLSQLKYPTEYMYAGFRDKTNALDFDQWHMYGQPRARTNTDSLLAATCIWNSALNISQLVCREAKEVGSLDRIVDAVQVTAHNIDLFPELPVSFYNTYLPQRYFNETRTVAPDDASALLVTFCLYPGKFNPSGYYNLSAGRELYLSYKSSTISTSEPAELVVASSALSFLVRRGDNVALRFAL